MTRYSRAEWGARSSRGGPGNLTPSRVEGIALHWPAMSRPLRGFQTVAAALRGWQNYHMDGQGWSDIGYQLAVDQDGNRYDLRGIATQSGANGDTDVNERFGAVLLILAPGEEPTGAMVTEVRNVIADHRRLFPHSRRIVGHSDIRPEATACPGPAVTRGLRAGVFNPNQTEETDMPLTDKDYDEIAQRVWAKDIGGDDNRKPARLHLIQAANASLRTEANQLSPEAVAAAVVAALPAGRVNEATVVAGVKRALAELVNGD
jgi:hypothetical protein